MIRVDVQQGSPEWLRARLGIPTASRFDQIITPKTGKLSSSIDKLVHTLLAEQLLGVPMDGASSAFMERGEVLERKAVEFYEFERGVETEPGGFVLRNDRRVGCSPDRFVGPDGLLEIKCPSAAVHIGYLLDRDGIGYKPQVQGQLWLCEREWSDTLSYNPDLPPALVRQARDEDYITLLAAAVEQCLSYLDECKIKLQAHGLFLGAEIPGVFPIDDGVRRCSMCKREAALPSSLLCETCKGEAQIQVHAEAR
jgi:hypothetical protein